MIDAFAGWTSRDARSTRGPRTRRTVARRDRGAELVATVDDERREIAGRLGGDHRRAGRRPWAARATAPPTRADVAAGRRLPGDAGPVNTHHHIYQNLTRGLSAGGQRRRSSTG